MYTSQGKPEHASTGSNGSGGGGDGGDDGGVREEARHVRVRFHRAREKVVLERSRGAERRAVGNRAPVPTAVPGPEPRRADDVPLRAPVRERKKTPGARVRALRPRRGGGEGLAGGAPREVTDEVGSR